jgi:hypothetical protein
MVLTCHIDRHIDSLDFSGSLTYLGCTALSLYLPTLRARSLANSQGLPLPKFPGITSFHPRQIIMSGLTVLWTARLGFSIPLISLSLFRVILAPTNPQVWW